HRTGGRRPLRREGLSAVAVAGLTPPARDQGRPRARLPPPLPPAPARAAAGAPARRAAETAEPLRPAARTERDARGRRRDLPRGGGPGQGRRRGRTRRRRAGLPRRLAGAAALAGGV